MPSIRSRPRPQSVPIMMNRNTQKKSIRVSSSLQNKRNSRSKSATQRNRSMRNRSMRNRSKSESSLVKLYEGDKKTKLLIDDIVKKMYNQKISNLIEESEKAIKKLNIELSKIIKNQVDEMMKEQTEESKQKVASLQILSIFLKKHINQLLTNKIIYEAIRECDIFSGKTSLSGGAVGGNRGYLLIIILFVYFGIINGDSGSVSLNRGKFNTDDMLDQNGKNPLLGTVPFIKLNEQIGNIKEGVEKRFREFEQLPIPFPEKTANKRDTDPYELTKMMIGYFEGSHAPIDEPIGKLIEFGSLKNARDTYMAKNDQLSLNKPKSRTGVASFLSSAFNTAIDDFGDNNMINPHAKFMADVTGFVNTMNAKWVDQMGKLEEICLKTLDYTGKKDLLDKASFASQHKELLKQKLTASQSNVETNQRIAKEMVTYSNITEPDTTAVIAAAAIIAGNEMIDSVKTTYNALTSISAAEEIMRAKAYHEKVASALEETNVIFEDINKRLQELTASKELSEKKSELSNKKRIFQTFTAMCTLIPKDYTVMRISKNNEGVEFSVDMLQLEPFTLFLQHMLDEYKDSDNVLSEHIELIQTIMQEMVTRTSGIILSMGAKTQLPVKEMDDLTGHISQLIQYIVKNPIEFDGLPITARKRIEMDRLKREESVLETETAILREAEDLVIRETQLKQTQESQKITTEHINGFAKTYVGNNINGLVNATGSVFENLVKQGTDPLFDLGNKGVSFVTGSAWALLGPIAAGLALLGVGCGLYVKTSAGNMISIFGRTTAPPPPPQMNVQNPISSTSRVERLNTPPEELNSELRRINTELTRLRQLPVDGAEYNEVDEMGRSTFDKKTRDLAARKTTIENRKRILGYQ